MKCQSYNNGNDPHVASRGWEDEAGKEGSALYCVQEDIYWLPWLARAMPKQTWWALHTKATTAEAYTTETLPGITESWHRAGIGAFDSSLKHGLISSSVRSRLKLRVKLYIKIYSLKELVCGCHRTSSLVVLPNSIPNKRISAYINFHLHPKVHQTLNIAFQ